MTEDDNDDNSRNRVITEITALKIPENSRIIDFEFYNDKILICLIKYHYEDGDIYKLGWVNYNNTKFTSLSQKISKEYNNLQLSDFLDISKLKAHNLHLHNSITIKNIIPHYLRISFKRGLLCIIDKRKKGICIFTIEDID